MPLIDAELAQRSSRSNVIGRAAFSRMVRRIVAFVFPLALVLTLLGAPAWSEPGQSIRLVGFDYPPFYIQNDGITRGIAVDLATELFRRLELSPEMHIYPLQRALNALRDGDADGTMILIKTVERDEFLHFTEPVMTVRGLIWSAADREGGAVNFEELHDLRGYKIGVTRGYSYGQKFDELLKTMDVDVANEDYFNYLKLMSHRIDIFPGNEIVAEGLFKAHPELRGKFVHSDKSFIEWVLRIAISRKSQYASLLPRIEEVLSDMKDEGEIDAIVRKYTQ